MSQVTLADGSHVPVDSGGQVVGGQSHKEAWLVPHGFPVGVPGLG